MDLCVLLIHFDINLPSWIDAWMCEPEERKRELYFGFHACNRCFKCTFSPLLWNYFTMLSIPKCELDFFPLSFPIFLLDHLFQLGILESSKGLGLMDHSEKDSILLTLTVSPFDPHKLPRAHRLSSSIDQICPWNNRSFIFSKLISPSYPWEGT